ncbi:hypothetical protein AG1IA_06773 [Rhizoctonia solani AG-1 IA]|uniref:Uncharacterized protein n=1 Tax=Thanatephorus cucumeris (strain AG1-IA) TaxID=983506 RepID=L8WR16_THACA|nr:hypothetical protein AG1IA_06773 [Rhizoctonia solani AG-1 IA]
MNNFHYTGTLILSTHDSIIGPGGQHVYKDSDAWITTPALGHCWASICSTSRVDGLFSIDGILDNISGSNMICMAHSGYRASEYYIQVCSIIKSNIHPLSKERQPAPAEPKRPALTKVTWPPLQLRDHRLITITNINHALLTNGSSNARLVFSSHISSLFSVITILSVDLPGP